MLNFSTYWNLQALVTSKLICITRMLVAPSLHRAGERSLPFAFSIHLLCHIISLESIKNDRSLVTEVSSCGAAPIKKVLTMDYVQLGSYLNDKMM